MIADLRRRLRPATVAIAAAGLIFAVVAAFANGMRGTFLFDDRGAIVYNGTIRHLTEVLRPPAGTTVTGRPVLNVSFALDAALHDLRPLGFHVTNIAIHGAVALVLFGLVRRTLARPGMPSPWRQNATVIGWLTTLVWALHPVQTESVTYLVQRAEALMSLFLLLTLYCSVRATESKRPIAWQVAAVTACALGMATKENMACAPVLLLLYDRAFIEGSVGAAWRRRPWFYVALAATWLVLGALVLGTGGTRGGSAAPSFGLSSLAVQGVALAKYAMISFWPARLTLDYGPVQPAAISTLAMGLPLLAAAIFAALYAIVRYPRAGVLIAAAGGVLAPTACVTTQFMAEHRLYLPLAAAVVGVGLVVARLGRTAAAIGVAAALALAVSTAARNSVYRSEVAVWSDTVAKRPQNAIAHSSLGAALAEAGDREGAIREYRTTLVLRPNHVPALANLALALTESGRAAEALPYAERAVALEPTSAQAQLHLALAQDQVGRGAEALGHYAVAVQLMPLMPQAHNDYGAALSRAGNFVAAIEQLRTAIALDPGYVFAYLNLGNALLAQGDAAGAHSAFEQAIALRPNDVGLRLAWARQLAERGHADEADAVFARALSIAPQSPEAHFEHGNAFARRGRFAEAAAEFHTAATLRPSFTAAQTALGDALMALNRAAEAIQAYRTALEATPNDALTHNSLGIALAQTGHLHEAAGEFQKALQIDPNYRNARVNWERARAALEPSGSRS